MNGPKPLRVDAARNRARVLDVAGTVFAERGTGVSTEEIARTAGVGIGTVFRHFPTKEALLEAVFTEHLRRLALDAVELEAAEEPGAAFFSYFAHIVRESSAKRAFASALAEAGVDLTRAHAEVGADLRAALQGFLQRAQQAGAVRPDLGLPELMALLVGASSALEHAGPDPSVRDATLGVVLDGMRSRG